MTKNQIEYNKLLETRRANRAGEMLTSERDAASRRLGLQTLEETARHNQQVELQARDNLAEQYRNNLAQLQELHRTHLVNEGIAQQTADAQYRQVIESGRHNRVNEELTEYATLVNKLGAELGASSRVNAAGISASAAQYASDNALLAKQLDLDFAMDKLATDVGLATARISEDKRKAFAAQAEINRANRVAEAQRGSQLGESVRHNLVSESQNKYKQVNDVQLRQAQNVINQQLANVQKQRLDLDITLAPSQRFANVTRGVQSLTGSARDVMSLIKKGR